MKTMAKFAVAAIVASLATETLAEEWNVSLWGKRRAFTEHVEKLAELVSAKTNGEFTMNVSYGGQFCAGYHRDKNPTITVLELPFMGVANLQEEVAVSNAVYAHPATQKDLARWNAKLLMTSPMPQYNIVGTGEPRDTLAKMEGMRVRATGGIGNAFKAVGATPTSVTSSEAYNAMESGVVDTVAFAQHAHLSFRTIDQATWWSANLNPGTVNCPVVVNIDAYEGLSDAHRAALDSSIDEAIDHYLANYGSLLDRWETILAEKNVTKVELAQSELDAFRAVGGEPIQQKWIQDMEAQGIPGQELFDLVKSTLASMR